MFANHQLGTRLSYVVQELEGTVQRPIISYTKGDGLKTEMVEEPAGFLVYFPRGHVIRFKDKASLARYGLDQPPSIINLQGLNDPRSPIGKLMTAQDENVRRGAMTDMEKMVIQLATAKTGTVLMPEQLEE